MSVHAAKGLEFPVVVIGDITYGGGRGGGGVLVDPDLGVLLPQQDDEGILSASYSLGALAEALGLPPKGTELMGLKGVRNPSPTQMAELKRYAINDVEITQALLLKLLPEVAKPEMELRLMDQCIRLFTERGFDTFQP